MGWTELSFDPDSVASTSDVASSAMAEANAASAAAANASDAASKASVAAAKGSDASSKIAAKSSIWDKASAASSVVALMRTSSTATPELTDKLYGIDDQGESPLDRKFSIEDVLALAQFVDRGDPSTIDFDEGDLTLDGTWNDLDLSSIVPAGAIQVLIRLQLTDDAAGSYIGFRENGKTNAVNLIYARTQVALVTTDNQVLIPLDSNRVIEYRASVGFDSIDIVIMGWW